MAGRALRLAQIALLFLAACAAAADDTRRRRLIINPDELPSRLADLADPDWMMDDRVAADPATWSRKLLQEGRHLPNPLWNGSRPNTKPLTYEVPPHMIPDAGRDRVADIFNPTVKIYIYEFQGQNNYTKYGDVRDSFYGLDQMFPQLLRESPYVTDDPEKATHFYVDWWLYWPWADMLEVVKRLKAAGPWLERKGGWDHIFAVSFDNGRCVFQQPEVANATYLHHFGRLLRIDTGRCNLFEKWGDECDTEMEAAILALKQEVPKGCHKPGQDIIVPPTPYEWHPGKPEYMSPYTHKSLSNLTRNKVLFYSGKIDIHAADKDAKMQPWSDASYSFGARQTVYRMHGHRPNYAIYTSHTHGTYWQDLSTATYCLAAAGWAWGGRMKVAASRGCIPIIVQDGMLVEWEEQVNMRDYALRIPTWLVHKLHDVMDLYTWSGRAAGMQKVLSCAWRLHLWRRPYGRAFEMTICELKRRVLKRDKILVNWDLCTLDCGDGKLVFLKEGWNNIP